MTYRNPATERLFAALAALQTPDECARFLEDACTIRELIEISQRLEVARLLTQKKNYQQISEETGVSTATISRVNRCLTYGSGGYQTALERLGAGEDAQ